MVRRGLFRGQRSSPPARGRGLRGGLRAQRFLNGLENSLNIPEHVVVPEADYSVALSFEKCCPLCILSAFGVLSAIQFNNQLPLVAHEVAYEWADGHLARKLEPTELASSQVHPKSALGVGRVVPQVAGTFGWARAELWHWTSDAHPQPLPQAGGESLGEGGFHHCAGAGRVDLAGEARFHFAHDLAHVLHS